MPRNRFVVAESVRYELSDGDWVEFKKRLTYGEQQALAGRVLKQTTPMGRPHADEMYLDMEHYSVQRLAMYIAAWSLQKPVSVTTLAALDQESGAEVDAALDKHLAAMEEAKNAVTPPTDSG
jgi:hypothetical protein